LKSHLAERLQAEHTLSLKDLITVEDTLASCAVRSSYDLKASLILAFTHSGKTVSLLAKQKPQCPVLVVTPNEWAAKQTMLLRGTFSMLVGSLVSSAPLLQKVLHEAYERGMCKLGDTLVFISFGGAIGQN